MKGLFHYLNTLMQMVDESCTAPAASRITKVKEVGDIDAISIASVIATDFSIAKLTQ